MAFLAQFFLQELLQEVVEVAAVATVAATTTYVGYKTVKTVSDMAGRDSGSSSSSTNSGFYLGEHRTIYDWWGHGLTSDEYYKLQDWGYNTRTECFPLEEVKSIIRCEAKAPGKPTEKDGFKPKKGWDGETLVRAPKSPHKKGYPHEDGSVWVPTGRDTNNVRQHGGPHWDVEYPDGSHRNARPKK